MLYFLAFSGLYLSFQILQRVSKRLPFKKKRRWETWMKKKAAGDSAFSSL